MQSDDTLLWERLRQGQHQALEQIYRSEFDYLYDYGQRIATDASLVEDAIQELFVEIWQRREKLSKTDAIRPYLIVSLRRKLYRSIKSAKRQTDVELSEEHFEAELSIDQLMINAETCTEQAHKLKEAYAQLSSRQQEIIYLKYYANLSYEEISEAMDLNYQSARNLVSRAISKLSGQMLLCLLLTISWLK